MLRLVTCTCVLTVAASCMLVSEPANEADVISIFLTGNGLGALKPCGCSGGQLGGLDRRPAVFNTVPVQRRMIVDTGLFVESDGEQDLIKFGIMMRAYDLLDYDLVNLTEEDVKIAEDLGLLEVIGSFFNIITSEPIRVASPTAAAAADETGLSSDDAYTPTDVNIPAKFTKKFSVKGETVAVTIATFNPESAPIEQIGKLFPPESGRQTVNILILKSCAPDIINSIRSEVIVDCLICPAESDEPALLSAPGKKPMVFSVGRFGKYVSRLQIMDGKDGSRPKLSFCAIPVGEDLRPEDSLVELYKQYQQLVRGANLLADVPRFFLPNGLEYTGSRSCKTCHEYEYEKWSTKPHAHAYETLKIAGSEVDPECVGCHVVGLKYESGFVSEQETADLKDVGCEVCHGPGSEHIKSLGETKTTAPKMDCIDCHTPENSANYADNEALYFEKIIHWREPKAQRDVK
jgi:hypothetical protein